jgi:hypothetical protein
VVVDRQEAVTDDELFDVFIAGFLASGEGFNGEYPFDDEGRDPRADEGVLAKFEKWKASR